jgi:inositol polyphosphate-4-phosphatase
MKFARLSSHQQPGHAERFSTAISLMSKLENVRISTVGGKNVELLSVCQEFTRLMSGGRMTCCKSGKDRTSMSVTLECSKLMLNETKVVAMNPHHLLSVFRRRGVRRQNLIKNIKKPYYAFNQIQWMNLPKMYRPPNGCYGSGVHS